MVTRGSSARKKAPKKTSQTESVAAATATAADNTNKKNEATTTTATATATATKAATEANVQKNKQPTLPKKHHHPLARVEGSGLNRRPLLTGMYGARGERIRHVVATGALAMPQGALDLMAPFEEVDAPTTTTSGKSSTTKGKQRKAATTPLPGLDSVVRPCMDKSLRVMSVTDIFHKSFPNNTDPELPPIMRTVAMDRTVNLLAVVKTVAVVTAGNAAGDAGTERIRGGGDSDQAPAITPAPATTAVVADATAALAAAASVAAAAAQASNPTAVPLETTAVAAPPAAPPAVPPAVPPVAAAPLTQPVAAPPTVAPSAQPLVAEATPTLAPPAQPLVVPPTVAPPAQPLVAEAPPTLAPPAQPLAVPPTEAPPAQPVAPVAPPQAAAAPQSTPPVASNPVLAPDDPPQAAAALQSTPPVASNPVPAPDDPPQAAAAPQSTPPVATTSSLAPVSAPTSAAPVSATPAPVTVATPAPVSVAAVAATPAPVAAATPAPVAAPVATPTPVAATAPVPVASSSSTAPTPATAPSASVRRASVLAPLEAATEKVVALPTKPKPQWEQHIPADHDENATDPQAKTPLPDWFSASEVTNLERTLLPEWFDESAPHRTEDTYLKARSTMMHISDQLGNRFVTSTLARRSLPGDVGSLHRLHHFLTQYMWMNGEGRNDSAPTASALQVPLQGLGKRGLWTEKRRSDLIHAVVEVSQQQPPAKKQKTSSSNGDGDDGDDPMEVDTVEPEDQEQLPIDWEAIAAKVGASAGDCEREFLAMPLDETAAETTTGGADRPITPEPSTQTSGSSVSSKPKQKDFAQEEFLLSLIEESSPDAIQAVTEAALRVSSQNLRGAQSAARLGLVANQAVQAAHAHEETVSRLLSEVVDQRMKKLECRMALMDDLEGMLEAERVALELERRDLYTTKCRDWFGGS